MKFTFVAMNASFLFACLIGDIFQNENVLLMAKKIIKFGGVAMKRCARKTRTNIRVPYSV